MDVKLVSIDDIKPYEGNPRLNDQAVDAVAASLREFGFRQPIVVDEAGVIIVGHTRWKAAKKLGLAKVPVHVAKDLSPEQAKAYRLADNQTNTLAEWNYELLPIELKDLQAADFNLELLGFDADSLAKMLDPGVKDGQCDPDEVPAPPDEAVTRPGDLYILGDHRLLCGDSGKAEDVDLTCPHFMYQPERESCLRLPACAAEGEAQPSPEQHTPPRTPRGASSSACCAAGTDCNPSATAPQCTSPRPDSGTVRR